MGCSISWASHPGRFRGGEAASLAAELKLRKSWAAQETEELEQLRAGASGASGG